MIGLLVSVRNAAEARAAVRGGADVIDVKEPARGPLGRAEVEVWRAVRAVVPPERPISVALGELSEAETLAASCAATGSDLWSGLAFRKLGLGCSGRDWHTRWSGLRERLGPGPAWIAVAYADHLEAQAPEPDAVLEAALESSCSGILLDTWRKSGVTAVDERWGGWIKRAQRGGLLVALAGGLDEERIRRLIDLRPDLFAVRGAACFHGDRAGVIDPDRVRRLAALVHAAAELSWAARPASRPSAASWPERMQSGTPTPPR